MCNTCSVMRIVWGHWPSAHTTEKWLIGNWNCYIKFRGMAHWNFNFIWKNGKWPLPWFAHPYHCMLLLILGLKDKLKLCVICMYTLVIYIYIYGMVCYVTCDGWFWLTHQIHQHSQNKQVLPFHNWSRHWRFILCILTLPVAAVRPWMPPWVIGFPVTQA